MISVVIPNFNRRSTLKRSIESVLNQTYQDFEIIIVDDASTDGSVELVKNMNNSKIKVIANKENKGANYCRNIGIKESKGEYIAFQDSDDEWLPNKLECQIKLMDIYDVVGCRLLLCDENSKKEKVIPLCPKEIKGLTYEQLLPRNLISTQTILGKREVFMTILFDERLSRFQDWDLMLRVVQQFSVYYDPNFYVKQYYQEDSITKNPDKAIFSLKLMRQKYLSQFDNDILENMFYFQMSKVLLKKSIKKSLQYYLISRCLSKKRNTDYYKELLKQILKIS